MLLLLFGDWFKFLFAIFIETYPITFSTFFQCPNALNASTRTLADSVCFFHLARKRIHIHTANAKLKMFVYCQRHVNRSKRVSEQASKQIWEWEWRRERETEGGVREEPAVLCFRSKFSSRILWIDENIWEKISEFDAMSNSHTQNSVPFLYF